MNYPSHPRDPSKISLGERRRNSDLARFSLELNWSNTAKNSRGGPYPSPPMSGSPLSQRRNQDFDERGQGPQDVRAANVGPRASISHQSDPRALPPGQSYLPSPHQEPQNPVPYIYGRPDPRTDFVDSNAYNRDMHLPPHAQQATNLPASQPQQQLPQHQQRPSFRPPPHGLDRQPPIEPGGQPPKAQRKTKGHVASACVPCKKAHLRCDAQRPCSRCHSNGKEDLCVDMQHKKRGRPRLREDAQQQRYEGLGNSFRPSQSIAEASMRRPLSMYTSSEPPTIPSYSSDRAGPYRVLKSHAGPRGPRHLEFASQADPNMYGFQQPRGSQSGPSQEPLIAYLNMELSFVKVTGAFNHSVLPGAPLASRKLLEIVAVGDRDKVYRLQRELEDERRSREPNYLPPILGHLNEDRAISSTPLVLEAVNQVSVGRLETITFQAPDGHQIPFDIQIGLAKKESTYFVTFILMTPPPQPPQMVQDFGPAPSSSFLRDSPQYGYHSGPPAYGAPAGTGQHSSYTMGYQPGGSSMASHTGQPMPPYGPMSQPQQTHHTPRSEMQNIRTPSVQLPPIRSRPNEGLPVSQAMGQEWQSSERNQGRVDIGGLLDNPSNLMRRP